MKRVGFYTGKVYPDDVDAATIGECCTFIPKEDEEDEEKIQLLRLRGKINCSQCPGECPESQK